MNREQIEALPNDAPALKREIARLSDIVASHEAAKAQRRKDAEVAAASPAANFEIDVFNMKASLEGLSDGSEDYTDPITRGKICRDAIGLLDKLFESVPKQ